MNGPRVTIVNDIRMRDNSPRLSGREVPAADAAMNQDGKDRLSRMWKKSPAGQGDLVKRSIAGDNRAMEALYEQYKQPLFNICYRYTYDQATAEDLLQEVFIKVFTHLKDVQKEETFVAWMYRIAVNTCYSYLRSKRSYLQKTVALSEIEGRLDEAVYDSNNNMIEKHLDDAVKTLSGRLKSIFLLHDVQGFKHEEIAGMLKCSVGTSKSQLFKARMKIREYLIKRRLV